MARILEMGPNGQRIRAHSPHKGVVCEHQAIDAPDGTRLLHLSTFGSKDRVSDPKSSQSLQIDAAIAAEIVRVMRETFGDKALRIRSGQVDGESRSEESEIDEDLLRNAYKKDPEAFKELIRSDAASSDVVAMAYRREQLEHFRRLLTDEEFFDAEASKLAGRGKEAVWQQFFEKNPWIFGVSLSGQLLTSWSDERLEQVVAGHSIAGVGKRTDALLRTSGRVRSMVFAEIKTHRKELLEWTKEAYRSGCWAPSPELSGGIVQVQGTVHRAVMQIGDRLQDKAQDGSDLPDEFTYLLRPRTYLVIGSLNSLRGEKGGFHQDKIRSFELFRRELVEPEVLTFDELLSGAEWIVASSSAQSRGLDEVADSSKLFSQ
ncbi:Shedu immune nuclease family protein [Nocardia niigatensis]|uniref:Shedu immune nuclease family protein n=1 Tax=Nocardia niigatensis TaxID=209249 RepID=UPI0012F63C20|nr:Shedu immune nuclease family protein [Nocardia niigatensis]